MASAAPNTNAISEQWPHDARVPAAVDDERDGADSPTEQEQRRDAAAVEPVRDPPGHEDEEDRRDELGQPDDADVELVARDVEHLLEQHRDEHVETDGRQRRRHQISTHGRLLQDLPGAGHAGTLVTAASCIAIV